MKRRGQIRPEALIELRAAAEWYEEQREGLGGELVEEFERTLEDALTGLDRSAVVAETGRGLEIRRFRLERFRRSSPHRRPPRAPGHRRRGRRTWTCVDTCGRLVTPGETTLQ